MELKTHLKIDHTLSGELLQLEEGYARVELKTTDVMRADAEGLVHGGFCFSAADFAAMAAVNDPNVVLAKSEAKFLAPVRVGEIVLFEANVISHEGNRYAVEVTGNVEQTDVFRAVFYTVVLKEHVLGI
ncbi:MAG: thioesterase [Sulfurospirillum sp.]|nr:MAG: thioesterase [Sulfurospirillum sp.]